MQSPIEQKKRYDEFKKAGRCVDCGEKAIRYRVRCKKCRQKTRDNGKRWHRELKEEIMTHYCNRAPHCQCPGCHTTYIGFLTMDHIESRASKGNVGLFGVPLLLWLKRGDYPRGFQVLCWNCNSGKGTKEKCPMHGKEH
jgi:hypothetical protein